MGLGGRRAVPAGDIHRTTRCKGSKVDASSEGGKVVDPKDT